MSLYGSYESHQPTHTMSSTGRYAGVRAQLSTIEKNMADHSSQLEGIQKQLSEGGDDNAQELLNLEKRMDEKMAQMAKSYDAKLRAANLEIERLQKQLNIQKGRLDVLTDQSDALSRQTKENTSNLDDVLTTLDGPGR